MNLEDSVVRRTFTAEQVHLYVSSALSDYPALRDNARMHDHLDVALRQMMMQLTTWCLSGRIPTRTENVTIKWPDGAWQMFKETHIPHWFIQRFPVRYKERVVETSTHHYFVCPHLTTDPQNRHVQFMATGTRDANYFSGSR